MRVDLGDLRPKLDQLRSLLEDYDGAAGDFFSDIELLAARTEFAKPIKEIGRRIDDFEFDEALERLNGLIKVVTLPTPD